MRRPIPILMYHQVTPRPLPAFRKYAVTPGRFSAQMDWLDRAGYSAITVGDMLDDRAGRRPLPPRPVAITFDDGFRDCVDHAVPILEARGFTATFFLVAGLAGRKSDWLRSERSVELSLMDWPTARGLEASGFRCGAHGFTHARLTDLPPAACREELRTSRSLLEDELGREVRDMAYPYGKYNETVRALAEETGYRSACSVRIGLSAADDDPLALHRVPVSGRDSMADFVCRLHTGLALGGFVSGKLRGAWRRIRGAVSS